MISNRLHHTAKNPCWHEVDQLPIYKCCQGIEVGTTEKQLLLAVRVRREPELIPS